jgi:hypothetical protein
MALTVNHPLLKEQRVSCYYADVGTAGSAFIAAPFRGKIVKTGSIIYGALGTADAGISTKINGTAITGGTWTITQSGSAAGDVDSAIPTAANTVNEDDHIEFVTDGASSNTVPVMYWAVIQAA